MLETLIFRAEIDKGSNILLLLGDVHAAACGIEIEGLRPFDASQGFFDSLRLPGFRRPFWHRKDKKRMAFPEGGPGGTRSLTDKERVPRKG